MEKYLVYNREHPLGIGTQKVYRFKNNYGASVVYGVNTSNIFGLYELAVIKFLSAKDNDYELDYTTPITDNVLSFVVEEELFKVLEKIQKLK